MSLASVFKGRCLKPVIITLMMCVSSCVLSKALVFGVVPQYDSRAIQSLWGPILKEMELHSNLEFKLSIAPNIPAFEKALLAGKYDLAYMNPYHYILANKKLGFQPIVKDIGRNLFGIVVVKKDSNIKDVKGLDNKLVAFPAPNAMGAALIPRAEFDRIHGINITPRYVKSHNSSYINAAMGLSDASGGVMSTFNRLDPNIKDQLKIIYKTSNHSPHPVAVHSRISKEIKKNLTDLFLEVSNLSSLEKSFKGIPFKKMGVANHSDYLPLKKLSLEDYYVKQ
jgi:phosphonate transport system substrate-binding protein